MSSPLILHFLSLQASPWHWLVQRGKSLFASIAKISVWGPNYVGRQMHLSTFCLLLFFKLSLWLARSHPLSLCHAHTQTQTHTLFIIHTEKCSVRTSLSCTPDSAGCSVITTPAVHHPISAARCCACMCLRVGVRLWIFMIFVLRSKSTRHRKRLFSRTKKKTTAPK